MTDTNNHPGLDASTIQSALASLKTDPEFARHLERMQERVKDSLVAAGVTEDRIEILPGGTNKSRDTSAERVPAGQWCLLMLFDECWFSVKVH